MGRVLDVRLSHRLSRGGALMQKLITIQMKAKDGEKAISDAMIPPPSPAAA